MDNKLWEGHRMLLPEMREKILRNKGPKFTPPHLSEEALSRVEELIKFAQHFQKPLLVTYFKDDHPEENVVFSFHLLSGYLECRFDNGKKLAVPFQKIINVELL